MEEESLRKLNGKVRTVEGGFMGKLGCLEEISTKRRMLKEQMNVSVAFIDSDETYGKSW